MSIDRRETPVLEDCSGLKEQSILSHLRFERAQIKNTPFLYPSSEPTQKEIRVRQMRDAHITFISDEN